LRDLQKHGEDSGDESTNARSDLVSTAGLDRTSGSWRSSWLASSSWDCWSWGGDNTWCSWGWWVGWDWGDRHNWNCGGAWSSDWVADAANNDGGWGRAVSSQSRVSNSAIGSCWERNRAWAVGDGQCGGTANGVGDIALDNTGWSWAVGGVGSQDAGDIGSVGWWWKRSICWLWLGDCARAISDGECLTGGSGVCLSVGGDGGGSWAEGCQGSDSLSDNWDRVVGPSTGVVPGISSGDESED